MNEGVSPLDGEKLLTQLRNTSYAGVTGAPTRRGGQGIFGRDYDDCPAVVLIDAWHTSSAERSP